MRTSKRPLGAVGNQASPLLRRDDDGAAAAAIAAAAAAAAADGLVLRETDRGSGPEGPEGGYDSDTMDARSLQSPSVEHQPSCEGIQKQHSYQLKGQQHGLTPMADATATPSRQDESLQGSTLPYRQVINAACTSLGLHRLAEAFPFIDATSCICSDANHCEFSGGEGPQKQQQQRQNASLPMRSSEASGGRQQKTEKEAFSLFAPSPEAFACSCCDRHLAIWGQADCSQMSGRDGGSAMPVDHERKKECNWDQFAASLDRDLDAMLDQLDTGGVIEKMHISLAASFSAAVFAAPNANAHRTAESSLWPASREFPPSTSTPAKPESDASTPSTSTVEAPAEADDTAPSVETGGIFAVLAAVESQCNEITKKFTNKLVAMRCLNRQQQRQRQLKQLQLKPYQPLPAYARGQNAPLFPYRHTAPPPPSLHKLRERRSWLQRLTERRGSWEVREELPHVNASFPDAAWFSLGCCPGRSWRRLLYQGGATAAQQLELLRQLQGDDLVEGCFIIDTIRSDHTVSRRVVAGRLGRRDFMQALCSPQAVVRGWVVRCDKDRELLLVRLVGVEVYPSESSICAKEGDADSAITNGVAQNHQAPRVAQRSGGTPPPPPSYLQKRLLRAEVDIGSSGFYAALPLAAISRYEFIGGQASGCCGRFVCAGTALRVCLVRTPAAPGGFPNSSRTKGPYGPVPTVHSPHLDEATLNAAHAHVEATFVLPQEFRKSPILAELLQEPLGFASGLQNDAAHPQPEAVDFEEIRPLRMPHSGDSKDPLLWWDGGSALLLSRLPYMLSSSGSSANPVATHRQLHAFTPLHLLELAPPVEDQPLATSGTFFSYSHKKRSTNNSNKVHVFTEAEAWKAVLKRLSDGSFMSFLNTVSPCDAIRSAIARAEKDPVVRGGGVGLLLSQQQGADWAKRRLKAGVACARRQQLDQALQLYDSALQLRPDYADALIARGAAYANKLEYEKAAADLDAALALDPTNKNATKYRAIVAERMGEKEPGNNSHSGDRDRTPSPDRQCKSPEHADSRDMCSSQATTFVRKCAPSRIPLLASKNALSNAAAAANAVLEQAYAAGGGKGVSSFRSITSDLSRDEKQQQNFMPSELQKLRSASSQKQLTQSHEKEQHTPEKQRGEQQRHQQQSSTSGLDRGNKHKKSRSKSWDVF